MLLVALLISDLLTQFALLPLAESSQLIGRQSVINAIRRVTVFGFVFIGVGVVVMSHLRLG